MAHRPQQLARLCQGKQHHRLACGAGGCPAQTRRWNTWTDEWTWTGANAGTVGFPGYSPTHMYPQAILGSLAFDTSGRLVFGFVDRASVQGGNRQWGTDPTDNQFYETVSSADMLIAAAPAEGGETSFSSPTVPSAAPQA